jgi:hypothetical protein
MYLRETKRGRTDGSEVRYLQLAHNVRDPDTGRSRAEVVHNFGRADRIDRDALARLVRSISRELDAPEQVAADAGETSARWTRASWAGRGCWSSCGAGWASPG